MFHIHFYNHLLYINTFFLTDTELLFTFLRPHTVHNVELR